MRDKPNFRRRTMKQCKENASHWHCERHQPVLNCMNHKLHLNRNVFVIVTTVWLLLLLPAIVNCDNNVLNEIDNGGEVHAKNTLTDLSGGRVIGEKWLRQIESPYSLEMDLTVERSGKLFVEPGVTVHVAPMVGITVRGVLTALVSSMARFFFCTLSHCAFFESAPTDQGNGHSIVWCIPSELQINHWITVHNLCNHFFFHLLCSMTILIISLHNVWFCTTKGSNVQRERITLRVFAFILHIIKMNNHSV